MRGAERNVFDAADSTSISEALRNQQADFLSAAEEIERGGGESAGDGTPGGSQGGDVEAWARFKGRLINPQGFESLPLVSNETSEHEVRSNDTDLLAQSDFLERAARGMKFADADTLALERPDLLARPASALPQRKLRAKRRQTCGKCAAPWTRPSRISPRPRNWTPCAPIPRRVHPRNFIAAVWNCGDYAKRKRRGWRHSKRRPPAKGPDCRLGAPRWAAHPRSASTTGARRPE